PFPRVLEDARLTSAHADDSASDLEAIRTVPCRPSLFAGAPRSPGVLWSRLWAEWTEVVLHKLVVLYSKPADPDHFRDYYVTNHLPLLMNLPGLLAWRYSFDVAATQGEAPYFAVFEGDFAHAAAM